MNIIALQGLGNSSEDVLEKAKICADKTFIGENISIHAFDLVGFGKSEGLKGDIDSFDSYVDLLGIFIDVVSKRYSINNFYLFGASLGAIIVLMYQIKAERESVNGIIAMAPPFGIKVPTGIRSVFYRIVYKINPLFHVSFTIPGIASNNQLKKKPIRISVRFAYETVRALGFISDRLSTIKTPVLVLQGIHDEVGNVEKIQEVFRSLKGEDNEIRLYDTDHAFSDNIIDVAFNDAISWITAIS